MPDDPNLNPAGGGDPGAAGGDPGANTNDLAKPGDFLGTLPEEYQADPAFASFGGEDGSGLPGLAKSYAHAARMVGADKVALPGKDADEATVNEFHTKLGRPAKGEDYQFPVPEKDASFQHDPKMIEGFRGVAFKAGLSNKQVAEIMGWYNEQGQGQMDQIGVDASQFLASSIATLQKEWGNSFETRSTLADTALHEFGGDEVIAILKQTGLNNHPAIVKMFADLGETMAEDSLPGTGIQNYGHTPETAEAAIGKLQQDKAFNQAYQDADHPGHAAAVTQMEQLFKDAHPEKLPTTDFV